MAGLRDAIFSPIVHFGYPGDISIGDRGNYVLSQLHGAISSDRGLGSVVGEPRSGINIEALGRGDWAGHCRLRADACDNSRLSVEHDPAHRVECQMISLPSAHVGREADQHGCRVQSPSGGTNMSHVFRKLWRHDEGQDIAEYAVMLAVILVIVVGTIRLVGSNANNVFSSVASSIQ